MGALARRDAYFNVSTASHSVKRLLTRISSAEFKKGLKAGLKSTDGHEELASRY